MSKTKIIGLTGNIGSGKSTVAQLFSLYRWPVFNSDDASKLILKQNKTVRQKVIDVFGKTVTDLNHQIIPSALAAIVFNDTEKLEMLNKIIHPEVKKMFDQWLDAQISRYVIRESALLFETGIYKESFKNITVTCPLNERVKRVVTRSGIPKEKVFERESKQMPEEEKINKSDFIIYNFDEPLIPQVEKIQALLETNAD